MLKRAMELFDGSHLITKIRYSYIVLLVPMTILVMFTFFGMQSENAKYVQMLDSVVAASGVSIDFKKEFDYEAYLLVVESKSVEESRLDELLAQTEEVVDNLIEVNSKRDGSYRLESMRRYLVSLKNYKKRIEENLIIGNRYEENLQIWENDIQIVTGLFKESILQYIYYEVKDIQNQREEYQSSFTGVMTGFAVAIVCTIILTLLISYYIPQSITKPIKKLSEVTKEVADGNLQVRANIKAGAEVGMLRDSLNVMIDKISELVTQVKEEQIRLRKAEFELLQSQINPHFFYNTLDTIVWLAEAGEKRQVVAMVESLSDFFRASLNQGKEVVTIGEELWHIRSYLKIQQVRYQDILTYDIELPAELEKYLIPKITLQPLVENALYHGIKNKRGIGKIEITGRRFEEKLMIQVKDNGKGMTEERLREVQKCIKDKSDGDDDVYGLYNVNERIRLRFGDEYGIAIESTYMCETQVKVWLPLCTDSVS